MDEGLTGMNVASRESSPATTPHAASDTSRGSSVSSDLQREYEDILRYAIVTPKFDTALPNVYQSNIDGTESKRLSTLSTIAEVSMPDRSRSKCETSEKEEEESESASEVDERGVKHAVAIGRMAQSAQKEGIVFHTLKRELGKTSIEESKIFLFTSGCRFTNYDYNKSNKILECVHFSSS